MSTTPKERVIAALEHREADRVPTGENQIDGHLVEQILGQPTLYNIGWAEMEALWDGRRDTIVADYCTAHVEVPRALEWDYVRVPVVPVDKEYRRPQMTGQYSWLDDQGRELSMNPEVGNLISTPHDPAMAIDDLPDPDEPVAIDPSQFEAIRHVVGELGDTQFVIGRSPEDGTFPWDPTVGMEEFLVRMVTDPEFVHRAVEVYVNRCLAWIDAFFDAGVDAVMTTSDYCDNRGPMMGEDRFREFILPGLTRQCDAVHERGGYFIKHTDGGMWPLLDHFVDIGIDGWHGIQPTVGMDPKALKERYAGKLCLFGGVNCETLIEGPPEKAREEVRYAIEHAAPGGGLVVTNSNVVQPGTKLEHYQAARQAVHDFGRYPIETKAS